MEKQAGEIIADMFPGEHILRTLLWLNHGCAPGTMHLYGDDSEMQCHICRTDFLRATPIQIEIRFQNEATKQIIDFMNKDSK